jgi:uncharacterized membrane protein YvlD (DUF360 family)
MLLLSVVFGNQQVEFTYFWRIIVISILLSLVFNVLYKYIWEYGTWIAPVNILVTSSVNFLTGYCVLYGYSREMFIQVRSFWWEILILTIILHIISFYFWRRHLNKKIANQLNKDS